MVYNVCKKEKNEKARRLLKSNQVPCIIYGEALEHNIPIKISKNLLLKLMAANTKGSMISLNLDGKTINCVVKELQKNFEGKVIHVDFQAISNKEILKLNIPVSYIGEENLEIKRLALETFETEIELQGTINDIPENIEVNVSDLNFEDKILAKDIKLPENVKLVTDPDTILVIANSSNNDTKIDED